MYNRVLQSQFQVNARQHSYLIHITIEEQLKIEKKIWVKRVTQVILKRCHF